MIHVKECIIWLIKTNIFNVDLNFINFIEYNELNIFQYKVYNVQKFKYVRISHCIQFILNLTHSQ